jgi:hypothetical protein
MSTQVIITQAIDVGVLSIARGALVEGVAKTGDLIKNYALTLDQVFDLKDVNGNVIAKWFTLTGKDKKGIKAERALFVAAMIARGHVKPDGKPTATVDTYWARVKEASGYVAKGKVSGGTDVDSKTLAELKTMINRILKSEEDGQDCNASQWKGDLMQVFEGMGGDVDTLG